MQRNADLRRHLQPEVLVMGRAYLLGASWNKGTNVISVPDTMIVGGGQYICASAAKNPIRPTTVSTTQVIFTPANAPPSVGDKISYRCIGLGY